MMQFLVLFVLVPGHCLLSALRTESISSNSFVNVQLNVYTLCNSKYIYIYKEII